MKRKAKKSNISISRTTLYTQEKIIFACKIFFFKNVCSRTKNNLQLRKKTQKKFWWVNFKNTLKNFCRPNQKKMLVIHFPYMEIV